MLEQSSIYMNVDRTSFDDVFSDEFFDLLQDDCESAVLAQLAAELPEENIPLLDIDLPCLDEDTFNRTTSPGTSMYQQQALCSSQQVMLPFTTSYAVSINTNVGSAGAVSSSSMDRGLDDECSSITSGSVVSRRSHSSHKSSSSDDSQGRLNDTADAESLLYSVCPRIIRKDVRRNYGNMWANVLNESDPDMMRGYFEQFCSPILTLRYRSVSGSGVLQDYELKLPSNVFRFFVGKQIMFPDFSVRLNDVKVKSTVEERGKSRVVLMLSSVGTHVYSIPLEQWLPCKFRSSNTHQSSDLPTLPAPAVGDPLVSTSRQLERHRELLTGNKRAAAFVSEGQVVPVDLPALYQRQESPSSMLGTDLKEMQQCPRTLRPQSNNRCSIERTNSVTTFTCDEYRRIARIDLVISQMTAPP